MIETPRGQYAEDIRLVYEGELAAEQLYGALAKQRRSTPEGAKFSAIAAVEGVTHRALDPVAKRLGIQVAPDQLLASMERRLENLTGLTWEEFIRQARTSWPPYIGHFKRLRDLAPTEDRGPLDLLVAHEVALVEFIEAECTGTGGNSTEILERFLQAAT